jgi:hypothetical protein
VARSVTDLACGVATAAMPRVHHDYQESGTTPLYRLLWRDQSHFYTISSYERDYAIGNFHYTSEGIAGYVYDSQIAGTTPLHRLVNGPVAGTEHFYTTDASERDYFIERYGFVTEGIAAYVYDSEAPGITPLYELYK